MMDAKRPTPRHIIIKRPKIKDTERILKAREKSELVEDCKRGGERGKWVKR